MRLHLKTLLAVQPPNASDDHKLAVAIAGANPEAVKGFLFGLDFLKLMELKQARKSELPNGLGSTSVEACPAK